MAAADGVAFGDGEMRHEVVGVAPCQCSSPPRTTLPGRVGAEREVDGADGQSRATANVTKPARGRAVAWAGISVPPRVAAVLMGASTIVAASGQLPRRPDLRPKAVPDRRPSWPASAPDR